MFLSEDGTCPASGVKRRAVYGLSPGPDRGKQEISTSSWSMHVSGLEKKENLMAIHEIRARDLNARAFIEEKVREIRAAVGDGIAINALSGGVDSSTVTLLGHRALGRRLKTYFIQNGLMREGEPERIVALFRKFRVPVEVVDAQAKFFRALRGGSRTRRRRGKPSRRPFTGTSSAGS